MTNHFTIDMIEKKIHKLPLIDSEVFNIITLLNNPASNFEQIVDKLSPSLAARFLNIANSAYYGGREVRSIDYAVKLLGYSKMKDILITAILMDHFTKQLKDFDFVKFLKQAQFCTAVAKVLGEILDFYQLEDLFTVATLQNIGKLIIAVYFKNEHKQIVVLKKSENLPSCMAEKRILGMSHGEIGALVLQRFSIPQDICDAVKFHDGQDRELPAQTDNYLQHIARKATAIVGRFTLPEDIEPMELTQKLCRTIEAGKKQYQDCLQAELRSKGYQEIFPALLEQAAHLVSSDLKQHLRQRSNSQTAERNNEE